MLAGYLEMRVNLRRHLYLSQLFLGSSPELFYYRATASLLIISLEPPKPFSTVDGRHPSPP